MKKIYLFLGILFPLILNAQQTNILLTDPVAAAILAGDYDPGDYAPAVAVTDPAVIAAGISNRIAADSLKASIIRLSTFHNRNSGSDTLSDMTGIGAARRWVFSRFQEFSAANENRLLPVYLQFDQPICGTGQHRNILAILPGSDPANNGVILLEGHMDSRCDVLCDTACAAQGIEDNASGTALVMELARVMSAYSFPNTIVFMITTAEEQGLFGAEAFAVYCKNNLIPLRAVLNNDVIGGIICGQTSSPPSCPGLNEVDSTGVRLFSAGGYNSPHKQLSRFNKLEYKENLLPFATIPMDLRIMSPEDRTGRGGDHIPFREQGFVAMRFTAANEHGDASNGPGYTDRQHTSTDVLGVDIDLDGEVDSFFVNFPYLARNAVINGNAAAMAAIGVHTPSFTAAKAMTSLYVDITDTVGYGEYRIALRSTTNDWDTVYTVTTLSNTLELISSGALFVSVAAVNADGVESLFSGEKIPTAISGVENVVEEPVQNITLLQNRPNPFDEATWISFMVNKLPEIREAYIQITDVSGKKLEMIPVNLQEGLNEVLYTHGYGVRGVFAYTLIADGKVVDTRQMIFAN
jgi:hypothetical protein